MCQFPHCQDRRLDSSFSGISSHAVNIPASISLILFVANYCIAPRAGMEPISWCPEENGKEFKGNKLESLLWTLLNTLGLLCPPPFRLVRLGRDGARPPLCRQWPTWPSGLTGAVSKFPLGINWMHPVLLLARQAWPVVQHPLSFRQTRKSAMAFFITY